MRSGKNWIWVTFFILTLTLLVTAQSAVKERTLIVNGHSGRVMIYEIDGRSYVDISSLAQIANGTLSFHGSEIVLTIDQESGRSTTPETAPQAPVADDNALSNNFMTAAVQDLALIKDWGTMLAYGVTKGVPGDGSRLVVPRDRAAEGLRLANVAVATAADRHAMELLTNHFNNVKAWHDQLIKARKSMSTANYSMAEDALNRDPAFQKIASCSDFLGTMLPSGAFSDHASCH